MMLQKTKRIDMTQGNPVRLILSFSLPLIFGNLLQQLYTLTDSVVIGQFVGVNAFAAVGAVTWIIWLLNVIPRDLSNAFSIAASIRVGKNDWIQYRCIAAHAVGFGCILSVLVPVGMVLFLDPILYILQVSPAIIADARIYLLLIACSFPFTVMFYLLSAMLRAAGESRSTFRSMTVSTVINIVLDLFFILVLHWGVAGAAAATLIAQIMAFLLVLRSALRCGFLFRRGERFHTDPALIREVLRLWIPMLLNTAVIAVGGVYVQSRINALGTAFSAANAVNSRILHLFESIIISIQTGTSVYIGQNLGSGNPYRIRDGLKRILLVSELVSLLFIGSAFLFGSQMTDLFLSNKDPASYLEAHRIAVRFLKIQTSGTLFMTPMYLFRISVQTLGRADIPFVAGVVQMFARILTLVLLPPVIGETAFFLPSVFAWGLSLPVVAFPCIWKIERLIRESG